MANLSEKTSIDLKTVMWMLAAAVSYGVMFQQVQELRGDSTDMKNDIAAIKTILTTQKQTAALP